MRQGPLISINCTGCGFSNSERYQHQGDNGREYYCAEPTVQLPDNSVRYVGDSDSTSPRWCPFRKQQLQLALDREQQPEAKP